MDTEMMRDTTVSREGLTPPFQLKNDMQTDAISVCYSPHVKLVSAEWAGNMACENLRHAIRLLARTAAMVRAELLLIAIPTCFQVSEDDLRWIGAFMKEAMRFSPIRKVARVVPSLLVKHDQEAYLQTQPKSYELALFDDMEKAQRWLLEDRFEELSEDKRIHIPLRFNLRHMKNFQTQGTPPVAPSAQLNASAATPQKMQILDICTDYVAITIDPGEQFMRINWKKPPQSRQYRYGMLKACRALLERKLSKLLLNNQRMGVLTLEDQGWLISTAQKLLPQSELKKLAVVTSPNALQQLSSENIGQRLREASLQHITCYFLNEEEALDWLLTP